MDVQDKIAYLVNNESLIIVDTDAQSDFIKSNVQYTYESNYDPHIK